MGTGDLPRTSRHRRAVPHSTELSHYPIESIQVVEKLEDYRSYQLEP